MQVVTSVFAATPEEVLYGYGPLGIGVVVLGYFGYKMFNIILTDRDKAIADRDAMIQDVFTKVLPALAQNSDALEASQGVTRELTQVVKESNKQLETNTRAFEEVRYRLQHGQSNHAGGT